MVALLYAPKTNARHNKSVVSSPAFAIFNLPKPRAPLWAKPNEEDDGSVSLKWTTLIAALLVASAIWGIAQMTLRLNAATERKIMRVVRLALPPEPTAEEPKVIPLPEPPKRKEQPKEIKQLVVKQPPKQPEPVQVPETSPIPIDAPATIPEAATGISIPTAVGEPSRPRGTPELAGGGIRRGVASLIECDPPYPRKALQAGITGEFVVHMSVDSSGTVTDVKIISGSPRDVFERDIKRSLRNCKFAPSASDFVVEAPVVFKIN